MFLLEPQRHQNLRRREQRMHTHLSSCVQPKVNEVHYKSLLDALGRAGYWKSAVRTLDKALKALRLCISDIFSCTKGYQYILSCLGCKPIDLLVLIR
jgi:hypothetical protein